MANSFSTKDSLVRQCVLNSTDMLCTRGCEKEETMHHLLFQCQFFAKLWCFVLCWLGVQGAMHNCATPHAQQIQGLFFSTKKSRQQVQVMWLACVWTIWKERNQRVFKQKECNVAQLVDHTKVLCLLWLKVKSSGFSFDVSHWWNNLIVCLNLIDPSRQL